MAVTPAEHLEPLTPIIGRWRTTGAILDDAGEVTDTITGTDAYAWLPGGHA